MVAYAQQGDPILILIALLIGLLVGFTLGWVWHQDGDPL